MSFHFRCRWPAGWRDEKPAKSQRGQPFLGWTRSRVDTITRTEFGMPGCCEYLCARRVEAEGPTTACRGRGTSDILMSDVVPRECVILVLSGNKDLDVTRRGSREGRSRWRRGRTDGWGSLVGAVGWEQDVIVVGLFAYAAMAENEDSSSESSWCALKLANQNKAGSQNS